MTTPKTRTTPSRTRKTPVPRPPAPPVGKGPQKGSGLNFRAGGLWGVLQDIGGSALKGLDPTVRGTGSSGAAALGSRTRGPQASRAAQGRVSKPATPILRKSSAPVAPVVTVPSMKAGTYWQPGAQPKPGTRSISFMPGASKPMLGGAGAAILKPPAPVNTAPRIYTQPGQTTFDIVPGKKPVAPVVIPKAPVKSTARPV